MDQGEELPTVFPNDSMMVISNEASSIDGGEATDGGKATVPVTGASLTANQPEAVRAGFPGMVWLATFSVMLAITVFIGPRIVEEYAYAYNRGKSKAEYEVARVALKENPLDGISSMYEYVARKISPSVVHIDTTTNRFEKESLLFIKNARGQGSGVVYSEDGFVITNQHVVEGAREIRVTLNDRTSFPARVVGIDEQTDIAVLKIDATGMIPGEWADDSEIRVGTLAWAVGSPFGLDQSVTSGIVSGRHRRVSSPQSGTNADYVFKDLLQTDTPINPGNSGGPLVNAEGKIMGINTSIIGGSYQGVCFAVPSEIVLNVVDEIISKGRVERGFLGVHPEMVSYDYAREIGLEDVRGAYIRRIERRTPAARAGLQVGDVIRKWNDQVVESELTLFSLVAQADIDSTVQLVIFRDGEELTRTVRIASRDDRYPVQAPPTGQRLPESILIGEKNPDEGNYDHPFPVFADRTDCLWTSDFHGTCRQSAASGLPV